MTISITFGEHGRTEDFEISPDIPDSIIFNRTSIKVGFAGFNKLDGKWQKVIADLGSPNTSVNVHGHRYQFASPVDSEGSFELAAAG